MIAGYTNMMKPMRYLRNGLHPGLSVLALLLLPLSSSALDFNFLSLAGFSHDAKAALNRAAAQWSSRISDPVTVNIHTEFKNLSDSSVIGTAGSVTLITNPNFSNTIIGQLKYDASFEADDGIVAYLPTVEKLKEQIVLPDNFYFAGHLAGTKANFKALFPDENLDGPSFGVVDAEINFNIGFNFDFDNTDGVMLGHMDFETVAAHELGHALGFVSAVDSIDSDGGGLVAPRLLDLFRFGPGDDPSKAAEFSLAARNLVPGAPAFFDDTENEYLFSTGVNHDGRQASHWKDADADPDDALIDPIGMLDPTLAFGQVFDITAADLRALDLIGYDITAVPLPPGLVLFSSALLPLMYRNSRSGKIKSSTGIHQANVDQH